MTFDNARILLQADSIEKTFRGNRVLDGISMDVHAGEVIALIGPSGAGKSTFLRCLNYLEQPTGGSLSLDGEPVFADPLKPAKSELLSLRRRVGMVFQTFNLFPHLSVIENITMAQRLNGLRSRADAEDYALQLLTQVGVQQKAKARPSECSGGQQQRIAIARALSQDPELMLFDEPTSALDPEVGNDVLKVMRDLAEAGTTMIVVTHEMRFAERVADRVLLLDEGHILEEGSPARVFRHPEHERTSRFLQAVLDR
ncbi:MULTISPECIES: amino acid ABC transporter ATP-binding protein [Prauserella salsuginis group]|uniref:Amino acid ABC transporter ATP-binding protein n=1 Tax=Prauserella salsuginis TaxID=387889 RepID=A0ABW6G190_9PSEU|nr:MULTISPECIES: amino acid ABC transporter ATP-binding protein [Prauserella salsuginis group]MCR3722109.1 amino acid ABC transporter ATP-binding protein, PAAT family (TC 3.A.1.3.-) [Prauserella flava]MCR3736106.1 amino acid ABC transporter ATP-binding protein, PAAT family (TC 3.A.1.3.-) [Prauserella salsuginis]